MNGYVVFYNNQRIEIYAESLSEAKEKAVQELRVPRSRRGQVAIMLAEKDGEQVTHTADF